MENSSPLVLKNFSGSPEITPDAHALKAKAIALALPITKVENEAEQSLAVAALKDLKAIRSGMESTRKAVKAPVLELGKKIDSIAADFLQDTDREEMRLQGLINHFQRKQLELQREEQRRIEREQAEVARLAEEARRKREEAERANDAVLKAEAAKLETAVFDKTMEAELAPGPVAIIKPKGLVVKSRLNFQIEDPIVFCQAYPQFFVWLEATESLKVKRREILEELNREDGKGVFHETRFPEELPDHKDSRIVKPAGMRVFEETKSHVR